MRRTEFWYDERLIEATTKAAKFGKIWEEAAELASEVADDLDIEFTLETKTLIASLTYEFLNYFVPKIEKLKSKINILERLIDDE